MHNSSSSFANSGNWSSASFLDSAKAIGADLSKGALNPQGTEVLFPNASGTKQIVYDLADGYYRVQDINHPKAAVFGPGIILINPGIQFLKMRRAGSLEPTESLGNGYKAALET